MEGRHPYPLPPQPAAWRLPARGEEPPASQSAGQAIRYGPAPTAASPIRYGLPWRNLPACLWGRPRPGLPHRLATSDHRQSAAPRPFHQPRPFQQPPAAAALRGCYPPAAAFRGCSLPSPFSLDRGETLGPVPEPAVSISITCVKQETLARGTPIPQRP